MLSRTHLDHPSRMMCKRQHLGKPKRLWFQSSLKSFKESFYQATLFLKITICNHRIFVLQIFPLRFLLDIVVLHDVCTVRVPAIVTGRIPWSDSSKLVFEANMGHKWHHGKPQNHGICCVFVLICVIEIMDWYGWNDLNLHVLCLKVCLLSYLGLVFYCVIWCDFHGFLHSFMPWVLNCVG